MVVGTRVPVRVGRCQASIRQPEMVVFFVFSISPLHILTNVRFTMAGFGENH
jgi:hypothetical protein